MTKTLLIEIGTEELPPKALLRLSKAFAKEIETGLASAEFDCAICTAYATPRRLAVSIANVAPVQADRHEQRRGPAISAAFDDDGKPSKAALGFARSCGVDVGELGRIKNAQGEWLAFERQVKGRSIAAVLPQIIGAALAALPIPKRMRWGAGEVEFVRPVHWIVVLYGDELVACEILGLNSGKATPGHRFHHGGTLDLESADDYANLLEQKGFVIASFELRRQRIVDLIALHRDDAGGEAVIDESLLDEVTALVEWPVVICGSFDEQFLELPEEVLIASMQDHQKYFPVRAADGSLCNRFITISNIQSNDPAVVRAGNERVIRPRLADARFFFHTDNAVKLASRVDALSGMLFEKRLGSLLDKTRRVGSVVARIAGVCGSDADEAHRAATLSRCDLLSEMVGEFPELQGTMGGYYAAADEESDAVATAVGEFYYPRFAGDRIPRSATGRCVALADRLDSLIGIFGIGSAPTGDKDPFALRRAALGALRILIEGDIDLDLVEALKLAHAAYGEIALMDDTVEQVYTFMRDRLRGYYLERGIPADVCTAVLANDPTSPTEIARRIEAVVNFRALDAAAALAAANKRIANILKKLDTPIAAGWSHELLAEPAESALASQLDSIREEAEKRFQQHDYSAYMECLACLSATIDNFFDAVMVMSDNAALRDNRLALLADLHGLFTRVADISRLHES